MFVVEIGAPAEDVNESVSYDFTNSEYEQDVEQNDDYDKDAFFKLSEWFDLGKDNKCEEQETEANNGKGARKNYGFVVLLCRRWMRLSNLLKLWNH